MDGLTFCRQLKEDPVTADIGVVLLTGSEGATEDEATGCKADALLRKPFSPLELLNSVERIAGGLYEGPFRAEEDPPEEQLILYAQDLRRLLEVERGQRALIQRAYQETVTALASALESKDLGTGEHSLRVQRYAIELASAIDPALLDDESTEYGFLLHDVGKIGVPDKDPPEAGHSQAAERRLLEDAHGARRAAAERRRAASGAGAAGRPAPPRALGRRAGIPTGSSTEIPLGHACSPSRTPSTRSRATARIASARSWEEAAAEIVRQAGRQFDPKVVEGFKERSGRLRRIHYEFGAK